MELLRIFDSWDQEIDSRFTNHEPLIPTLNLLTHFMQVIFFDTPWKHQKTRGFLRFSGGIKKDHWHEMGDIDSIISWLILRKYFSYSQQYGF